MDPATWRDVAYLVGMFVPLVILGFVVLAVWLTLAAGITLPLWYWAPVGHYQHGLVAHGVQLGYFPNGPSGSGGTGFYIDTLPKALLAAAACLILFALPSYLLVLTARLHARTAGAAAPAGQPTGAGGGPAPAPRLALFSDQENPAQPERGSGPVRGRTGLDPGRGDGSGPGQGGAGRVAGV